MITRKAIGRNAKVGSLYDAFTDNFIGSNYINVDINETKLGYTHGDSCFEDTSYKRFKISSINEEHQLNILNGETTHNAYTKFLMEESNCDNDCLIPTKFHCLFLYEYTDFEREMSASNDILYKIRDKAKKMREIKEATHLVTKIKYGFSITALIKYSNHESIYANKLIDKLYGITINLCESLSTDHIDSYTTECIRIDFVISNNTDQIYQDFSLCEFISFIKKNKIKYYLKYPQEFTLKPLNEYLTSELRYYPSLSSHTISSMIDDYYDFTELSTKFKKLREESSKYKSFLSDNYIALIENDFKKLNDNKKTFLRMFKNYKTNLNWRKSNIIKDYMDLMPKQKEIVTFYDQWMLKLNEIQFYHRNNIKVLNKYSSNYMDIPNDSIIFCYNDYLKQKNLMFWKSCLSEFLYLAKENSTKCTVYDYDICNLNIPFLNNIHLLYYNDGKFTQPFPELSQPPRSTLPLEPHKKDDKKNSIEANKASVEDPKKSVNILLLGETGVGKSTFINAFYNYTKFKSLEEAEKFEEVSSLIASQFTFTDENNNNHKLSIGKDENECFIQGQSSTQTAKGYEFLLNNQIVRIIDTPGMGDSRGIEIDKKNYEETIQYISQFGHLNAICFLVKPNNARLHPGFRYCFKELLTYLHKNTIANICFCFTNCRGTLYKPGETMPALKGYLEEINNASKVEIKLNKSNTFCFDNEAFRYMVIIKNKFKIDENERKNFSNSWKKSSESSLKLLEFVSNLKPLNIKHIIMVNNNQKTFNEWSLMAFESLRKIATEWRKLYSNKTASNHYLKKPAERIVHLSSFISNYCCKSSLAIFNDDLEAYLEEAIREENKLHCFNKDYKPLSTIFKNILYNYQKQKKENFNHAINTEFVQDCFNEIMDINNNLIKT